MINIRYGAFETNSSSMHSLIIFKGGQEDTSGCNTTELEFTHGHTTHGSCGWLYTPEPWGDSNEYTGYIHVSENEFTRWPFQMLNNWIDKSIYLIAQWSWEKDIEEKVANLISIIQEEIPGFKGFKFNKDYTWNSEKGEYNDYESDDYGSVDHQSAGLLPEKLGVSIKEYLFNPQIMVVVDGDEYCTFDEMMEAGIIDRKNIEKRVRA